jgi:general secretion pathway protein K
MSERTQATGRAKPRRSRKRQREKRGVALVMVLGAITVLTVFLTQLQENTSAEVSSAFTERDRLRGEYYAKSGVNLARLLIAMEPEVGRSIAIFFGGKAPQIPIWAFSDMILGAFNGEEGAQAFGGLLPGADFSTAEHLGLPGGGRFDLKIVDEDAKLNLNSVYTSAGTVASELRLGAQILGLIGPPQYNPMFEGRDADGQFSDRAVVCGALVDWVDPDENLFPCDPQQAGPSVGGAEDNFYQTIGLPYRRKNAAFDSLDELHLVRGVNDAFWGTFVDPDPSRPDKRVITVWGSGQINVNTANALTLLALICGNAPESELCIDPLQMQSFVSAVTMVRTLFAGFPLFGSTTAFMKAVSISAAAADPKASAAAASNPMDIVGSIFQALGIKPVVFKDPKGVRSMITTRSRMFSIYAEGVVPGVRKETRVRTHAVVDFRAAQPLGAAFTMPGMAGSPLAAAMGATGAMGAMGGAGTAPPAPTPASGSAEVTPEQLATAMTANPAGVVVYYRVE